MGRKSRLTPELIEAIAKRVTVGSFPYVAAAACGIPSSTYYAWMAKGEQKGAPKIYRELRERVSQAAGAARASAEVRVFRDSPFQWLRYGPGRERPGESGWTDGPIQIEADVHQEVQHAVSPAVMAQGLLILQELGICEIKGLPSPDEGTLAVESKELGENGDGQTIDVEGWKPGDGTVPQDDGRV